MEVMMYIKLLFLICLGIILVQQIELYFIKKQIMRLARINKSFTRCFEIQGLINEGFAECLEQQELKK